MAATRGGIGADRAGHLVLVGGGPTPADVFTRTLDLSGGRSAVVAVLPQTYPNDTIGDAAVAMWQSFGVRDVVKVSRTDQAAARAAIERATLIWIPGGFQGLFMKTIAASGIPDVIRARFAAGVTIGGSSAGAAAVASVMIADESTPAGDGIGGPITDEGLGLWPEAIVSPHFSERHRLNWLIVLVKQHPALIGVGIDEGTAVIVSSGEITVIGRGGVTIVDPRSPSGRTLRSGARVRLPAHPLARASASSSPQAAYQTLMKSNVLATRKQRKAHGPLTSDGAARQIAIVPAAVLEVRG